MFGRRKKPEPVNVDPRDVVVHLLHQGLVELQPGWFVAAEGFAAPGGRLVISPNLSHDTFEENMAHVDFHVYLLNEPAQSLMTFSDCCVGLGADRGSALVQCVDEWIETTGRAVLELLTQQESSQTTSRSRAFPSGMRSWAP